MTDAGWAVVLIVVMLTAVHPTVNYLLLRRPKVNDDRSRDDGDYADFGYWGDNEYDTTEEPRHDMPTIVQLGVAILVATVILLWPFVPKRKEA